MGLDMYAWTIAESDAIDDFNFKTAAVRTELCQWRKHHDLHGWMENLYIEKGGEQEFNCVPLRLTEEDLLRLKEDILEGNLPPTSGFFFGNNPPDAESNESDLKFVESALSAIQNGNAVYYDSWW